MKRRYYVYTYLRDRDSKNGLSGSPYYVGKGTGNRSSSRRQIDIKPKHDKKNISIIASDLYEPDAYQLEMFLIYVYGRVDNGTGCLHNRTDGGEGLTNPSQDTKDLISAVNMGKVRSEETKKKIAASLRGKQKSPEHKKKLAENLKSIRDKKFRKFIDLDK